MAQNKYLFCFYGDDFTGSTDAMEALTNGGLRTVLFLEVPSQELLNKRFPSLKSFGIAGVSRTMNPTQMNEKLTQIFNKVKQLKVPIFHYKVCSTFDSSSEIGSIGKVIDIGKDIFTSNRYIPLLVGAPELKRFTVFGNHFAADGNETYRLDCHPTMSKHPITPMQEGDLRKHLSNQTNSVIGLINVLQLEKSDEELQESIEKLLAKQHPDVILFDALTNDHINKIGKVMRNESESADQELFVVGSSGVEYAIAQNLNEDGIIQRDWGNSHQVGPAKQVLVVSGSCSPITEEQIKYALKNNFTGYKVPILDFIKKESSENYRRKVFEEVSSIINKGENLLIYSALGPEDETISETKEYLRAIGEEPSSSGKLLGEQLGKLIYEIIKETSIRRLVIAGGDTSSYATLGMGIYGLEMIASIAPGAPLCRTYSEIGSFDGLEIALKGGQLGQTDYFSRVLAGNKNC